MDEDLRALERAVAAGDDAALAKLASARERAGHTGGGAPLSPARPTKGSERILGLAASADGRWLAFGRPSGRVMLWDCQAAQMRVLAAHAGQARGLRFSPDGAWLAVASHDDDSVSLWSVADAPAGRAIRFACGQAVYDVAFSGDGAFLAASCQDGSARVWDARTFGLVHTTPPGMGRSLAVGFAGDRLLVGHDSAHVEVFLDHGREREGDFAPFGRGVCAIVPDPIGQAVAFAGDAGAGVSVHAPGEWKTLTQLSVPRPMAANAAAFSPDGAHIVAACSDDNVRVWPSWRQGMRMSMNDLGRGGGKIQGEWSAGMIVSGVAYLNASWLVSSHFDGTLRFWPVQPDGHVGFAVKPALRLRTQDGDAGLWTLEGEDGHKGPELWGEVMSRR